MMTVRHVLSLTDVGAEGLARLVDGALAAAAGEWDGERPLAGKYVGIYFRKTSTRTRTSFTVGAQRLGASTIAYGPNDLQIATGESVQDTARVLSNYLDALVIRTNETVEEMRQLAAQERMSIVNAMSDNEHPTQAVADLAILKERFGRLDGLHVLYIGEGNNTTSALALATAMTPGLRLTIVTPEGYGMPQEFLASLRPIAQTNGGADRITQHFSMDDLPQADAVYTTRWLTMGVQKPEPDWLDKFRPYTIDAAVMARVTKDSGTIFLHDLPASRGFEVTDEVLDGPQSLAFRQAYHKMTGAMAVLRWCLAGPDQG
jgi:ornithine carbamoyltransferase